MKGLSECKASKSNFRRIRVKDIVKEVEDYLKTYSSVGIDISCAKLPIEMWNDLVLANEGPSDMRYKMRLETLPGLLYGKYNYKEGLIDQIYESETQRFTIQSSSSKALISNHQFQDSDSDVEEDQRTINEFMADVNVIPGNIVKALGKKGRRKEKISSKEVVFTKVDESSSMFTLEITFDSKSECDSQEPLLPLPKLIGAAPSGTSKMSPAYVIKKKTEKSSADPKPCSDKKADSSTE
ncbi:hypothetical protein Tco_0585800 [Tanacetum coccineum]